jgi:Pyruvate/2-oxoacid:ferredoxin oxidoreductase delta subunit
VLSQLKGFEINPAEETDHACRFRPCSNPDHLERVDQRTNTLRGLSPIAANARKIHCTNGHAFTPENTQINDEGWRVCRECGRESNRSYVSRPEVKAARLDAYVPKTGVRGKGQYQAQKDTCKEGHKLEGDNLIQEKRTRNEVVSYVRRCRTCVNAKARGNHAKRSGAK